MTPPFHVPQLVFGKVALGACVTEMIIPFEQRKTDLSAAEVAKTLVHSHGHGVLSTLGTDDGYPFGSVVDYAALDNGDVVVLLSRGAEHFRFLQVDSRASLLINPLLCEHDALSSPRITLQGLAGSTLKSDELVHLYLDRHPSSDEFISRDDLALFRLRVESIRFVGEGGAVSWVDMEQYHSAQPDPLGSHAQWLSFFLTEEYAKQLSSVARHLYGQRGPQECTVQHIDRYGFDMVCRGEDTPGTTVRINFERPCDDETAFMRAARALFGKAKDAAALRPAKLL